jgi:hypothetical protein
MGKRFVGLVIALASLLIVGGCYGIGPWGCARGGVGDCKSNVLSEGVSTNGSHKALVTVETCTYENKLSSSTTSVRVTGLQAGARLAVNLDAASSNRQPEGWPVFTAYSSEESGSGNRNAPTDITAVWHSDSELIISYPGGTHHYCDQPSGLTLHCVERGFAPSAPPRPRR